MSEWSLANKPGSNSYNLILFQMHNMATASLGGLTGSCTWCCASSLFTRTCSVCSWHRREWTSSGSISSSQLKTSSHSFHPTCCCRRSSSSLPSLTSMKEQYSSLRVATATWLTFLFFSDPAGTICIHPQVWDCIPSESYWTAHKTPLSSRG